MPTALPAIDGIVPDLDYSGDVPVARTYTLHSGADAVATIDADTAAMLLPYLLELALKGSVRG